MDLYVTGAMIKRLREERKMTQNQLAEKLNISDKTVSKWENAKGYPDISLIEPIAEALGISVMELLSGNDIINANISSNMLRTKWYVCPICGNVVHSVGEAMISCHGIALPPLSAEETDESHQISIEQVEDEYYIEINHDMTKDHYISFIAALSDNCVQLVKLYPEGSAEARFKMNRIRELFFYCNKDGAYRTRIKK
ncbi:MAG: helix-turn-helix domain-containing protein [Clostridia bacterium]|nr:helix-turn-helix domain-containing protein [Clostridia bacterium]